MEDKQLNFSQPLLSVRRFSSALTSQKDEKKKTDIIPSIPRLPSYKSEISGPITNAGTVPFVWEQIPGRPKSDKSPQSHAPDGPATVPKLPPGRTLKPKKQDSARVSRDAGVRNGPGGKSLESKIAVPLLEESVTKVDSSKEKLQEHSSDSGDGDEAFMDALDALSRAESSFYNCSVGGLSGVDSDLKPSTTFSIDPKTRDFMMGRFLPAAKAMASEAPQHAPRKQPVVREQPRQIMKVVNANKQPPLRYGPNYGQNYAHDNADEESDSEGDEHENTSFKVCGLLPRFAMKGSLCLLNPVSGMSQRTRVPISPVSRIMQASSLSQAGSCNKLEKEPARVAIYEQRPIHGMQAAEKPKNKRVLRNESHQIPRESNSQKLEGSTLYKRLQGNDNRLSESLVDEIEGYIGHPDGPDGAGFNGCVPPMKGPKSFKELLADQTNSDVESESLITEKTVYVDIIHKVGSEKKTSRLSGMKEPSNLREYDNEILGKISEGLGQNTYVHSMVKDAESLGIPCGESTLQPNVQNPVASSMLADESNEDVEIEITKDFVKDTKNYSVTKVAGNVNLDFNMFPENSEHSHKSLSQLPPPPPLPKSPSDSWLCRTLPYVPSKNASSKSYLGARAKPSSKASSTDPKWEKIVTTRAFMSALTPIPET